jgi:glutamate synthase (NADPH) small chain
MSKVSIFAPFKGWKYLFKKPVAIPMDDIFKNPRESQDNFRGFHTNDWEKCIGCGTCGEVCPTGAITMVERSDVEDKDGVKPERPVVDYGRCCFCGLCVDICTSGSLNLSKEYLFNSSDPQDYLHMPTENGINGVPVKMGYVKDETSDLLDLEQKEMVQLSTDERKGSFLEIVKGFSKEMAMKEASRCVACEICTKTCPANMNIPEYIKSVWDDDLSEGIDLIYKTNPLPSVCGRVCTHKCESACAISNRGDAVAIRWLKRYIVDNTPGDEYEKVVLSSVSKKGEGKVAIVGSGSSGLSAAYYLGTLGYEVDVFERAEQAGGPMRYGAPKYRLPDDVTNRDISFIEKIGVKIHTNTEIGKDIAFEKLEKDYDAVFVGTGYPDTRPLNIPGVDNDGVVLAMPFLAESADYERGMVDMPDIADDVIVIGSGNVAFDVARTLVRFQNMKYGKSNVKMVALETREQVPADIEEIEEGTEEGIICELGWGPNSVAIDEKTGKVTGLHACKCTSLFDDQGRFSPVFDNEDKKFVEAKQVYLAIGQMPDFTYFSKAVEEKMEIERGKIKLANNGQVAGIPWLFAGGDIVKGMDIINGIANGHAAALGIDQYIQNKK